MHDDLQGGLLATLVAAPIVVACYGGAVLLAAAAVVVGGGFTGLGGLDTMLVVAVAALTMLSMGRAGMACALPDIDNEPGKPEIHGT